MFAAIVGQSWADDAHPFNLEINGIDQSALIDYRTIRVEMPGPGSNGSLSLSLTDRTSSINVAEWDEVRLIEHAATRPILFGGFAQSAKNVLWARAGRTVQLECVGYGILLDKKHVTRYDSQHGAGSSDVLQNRVASALVSVVNRFGGRVGATAGEADGDYTSTVRTIPQLDAWTHQAASWDIPEIVNQPLRAAIDTLIGTGAEYEFGVIGPLPAGASYWVDSSARLNVLPDFSPDAQAVDLAAQWYGGLTPGFQVDESGTLRLVGAEYEREDTDRLTSVFIEGGAGSSGYYRAAALERAGDLEGFVDVDDVGFSDEDFISVGGSTVNRTAAATARGVVRVYSTVPLDVFPGRAIEVNIPRLGVSAGQYWRITSVRIDFRSTTTRVYEIGFGGSVPKLDAWRRFGKMQRIPLRRTA